MIIEEVDDLKGSNYNAIPKIKEKVK